MHVRALRGADHLAGIGRLEPRDVLRHRARKELDRLRQITDVAAQAFPRPGGDIGAIEAHGAGTGSQDPDQQSCERRLARGARADDAERFACVERERRAANDRLAGAAHAENHRFRGELSFGRRQCRARLHRRRTEQRIEPPPSRPRLDQRAPAGDQLLDRRQRPSEQDGRGDHHARGDLLVDNDVGAERHHRRLDGLAGELGHAGERGPGARGARLLVERALVELAPAPRYRRQHAERVHHLRIAQAEVDEARGLASFRLRALERRMRQPLVEERERQHGHGTEQRQRPHQRME